MNAQPSIKEYEYPTAFSGWGAEERAAIDRVCASDQFTIGYECDQLEREFAAFHGMDFAIACNSGSSANLLAIAALCETGRIKSGDVAAVPALAWSTTYAPLVQHGLDLALIDCDATWNAWAVPSEIDLLVACPVLGNPAHIEGAIEQASQRGIPTVVDCCESVGARGMSGRMIGTLGIVNTFSFYYSHQLSAVEGGMVLTNDPDIARACKMLRSHGWTRGLRMVQEFGDEYRFEMFGYNLRPVEMHSAVAREQLKKLLSRIIDRQRNYSHWLSQVSGLPITVPELRGGAISPFCLHFCVADRMVRQRLANALRAQGIDCRPPIAGSFRRQPYGANWSSQKTPVADQIHDRGMALGNAPFPIPHLIDKAVAVMREVL